MVSKKQPSLLGQCSVNDTYMPTIQQSGIQSRSLTAFQMPLNRIEQQVTPPVSSALLGLNNLFARIDKIEALKGLGVVFVQENSEKPLYLTIREPQAEKNDWIIFYISPQSEDNKNKLSGELTDAFLNCASAGLGILAIKSTVGLAAFLVGVPTAAAALQCGNSLGRVVNQVFSPESNNILDNQQWYTYTKKGLDVVGLVDFAGGVFKMVRNSSKLFKMLKSLNGNVDFKNFSVTINTSNQKIKKALRRGDIATKDDLHTPIKDKALKEILSQPSSKRINELESILTKHVKDLSLDATALLIGGYQGYKFVVNEISVTNQ